MDGANAQSRVDGRNDVHEVQSCYVCGNVVDKNKELSTHISYTCSFMCCRLLIFVQGLLCGNALCHLSGDWKGREFDVLDIKKTGCGNPTISTTNSKLSNSNAETLVHVVPQLPTGTFKSVVDLESNQVEDILQVAFAETENEAGVNSPISLASLSPSANRLPPVYKNQQPCVAITRKQMKNRRRPVQSVASNVTPRKNKNNLTAKRKVDGKIWKDKPIDTGHFITNQLPFKNGETMADISDKKRVECDLCGERFVDSHLYVHMKAKHNQSKTKEKVDLMFSCSECSKQFEKKSHLNKHLAKKHPGCEKLTKVCTICQKGFSNQIGLSVHMRHVHKALSPKECELCKKSFKSCKELSRHKLRDHKLRVHVCHLCGKNFAYGHALKSHLDAHAGVKKHFCEVCGEGFVRMTSLCGHRACAHLKKEDIIYKCDECDSTFDTKSFLNKHLLECHFLGPYAIKDHRKQLSMAEEHNKCQICKEIKTSSGQCALRCTEDLKQFICSDCGKTFSRSHYLKAHEKQHQEAKFSCDVCCKRFTYKCNLKAHRSTHSNDKPFQCSACSKKFRLKFLLEDHERTHNRDLLFKCYICGQGLTRIPNLKRHIKAMHPEVSYQQHELDLANTAQM